ncbi:MAG: PP2C family protein-serine/threonine phosphatase, partial [Phycisphaerae bacterium]
MARAHLQIIVDDVEVPANLIQAIKRIRATIDIRPLDQAIAFGISPLAEAVVMVARSDQRAVRQRLERALHRVAEQPRATLVMIQGPIDGLSRLRRPGSVPTGVVSAVSAEELAGRLAAMVETGQALRHQPSARLQATGQVAATEDWPELQGQLCQAARLQEDMLPRSLPEVDGLEFFAFYRPAKGVSGDLYDVVDLGGGRVGLWLADVCGNGLAAAMMTGFVKRCLSFKQGFAAAEPDPRQMLVRLNADLLEANLSDGQFVAATCAVIEAARGRIRWARGGMPHPVLVGPGQQARLLRHRGCILGAVQGPGLELSSMELKAGQALIFYSDGLESLLQADRQAGDRAIELTARLDQLDSGQPAQQLRELERLC